MKTLIILLFNLQICYAGEVWTNLDLKIKVDKDKESKGLISKCVRCEAKDIRLIISKNTVNLNMIRNGIDPNAVLCHSKDDAHLITLSKGRAEKVFCMFKDKSVISVDGLNFYYDKNSR